MKTYQLFKIRTRIVVFCFTLMILGYYSSANAQIDYKELHEKALVVDLHNDALYRYINGQNIETFNKYGQFDLVKMQKGGIDVQFFALWPDPRKKNKQSMFEQTQSMLDSLYEIVSRNDSILQIAKSPMEINRIVASGKTVACIGVEGGTALEYNLEKINYFYDRGIRYIGLTWNDSPKWASSAQDETDTNWQGIPGLNDFGKQVVTRMNKLGIIIDVSHAGEQTFYDVLKYSTKPVIASHSSVHSICPHFRNLKDDQIKALAANGGVIFINFYPGFLVDKFDDIYMNARKRATEIEDSLKQNSDHDYFDRASFIHQKIDTLYPGIDILVNHIEYIVKLVGEDHVGLGSDFCGISIPPAGLEDVSKMPKITKELVRRGYSESTIKKILGGNFMRVFQEVSRR